MKNILTITSIAVMSFVAPRPSLMAQGSFVNLDFESPILPLTPDLSFTVPITNALPGWTGLASQSVRGSTLFSQDYNIEGFGGSTAQIFSSEFTVDEPWSLDAITIEVTHDYARELELSLTSPSVEVFYLLQLNGARTRLGDGSGTLAGVEAYTFVEAGAPLGSVSEWDFNYRTGGTYDALTWPSGILTAGGWTIALRNVNVSGLGDGALGNITITGHEIPEPQTYVLALTAIWMLLARRR